MSKLHEAKHHINVKVDMDELDLTSAEAKATCKEIQDWVQENKTCPFSIIKKWLVKWVVQKLLLTKLTALV